MLSENLVQLSHFPKAVKFFHLLAFAVAAVVLCALPNAIAQTSSGEFGIVSQIVWHTGKIAIALCSGLLVGNAFAIALPIAGANATEDS